MNRNEDSGRWDDRLILGIPVIDKQHKDLLRIINNLHFTCLKTAESGNYRLMQAAYEAVGYIKHHFNTEEKLMGLLGFSGFSHHKREHENFLKELLNRYNQFQEDNNFVPNSFVSLLKEWALSHIEVYDRVFADFLLNMKHHEKIKLILAKESLLAANPA